MTIARVGDPCAIGETAYGAGDYDRARAHLLDAVARRPNDARAWLYLGLAERERGCMDAAAAALDRAIGLAPADAHTAMVRARIALESGVDAVAWCRRARALAPNDPAVILSESAALHQVGQGADAAATLRDALVREPGWVEGHRMLARLRWQLGDGAHSLDDFAAAADARPADALLWAAYLGATTRVGGHAALLDLLPAARAASGGSILIDMLEAEALAECGHAAADAALAAIPVTRDVAFGLVRIRRHLRAGRPAEAAALADTLLGQPGDAAVWPYLSLAWRLLGDARAQWLDGDPRLVSITDLGALAPRLPVLADTLRGLHRGCAHPYDQSPRGGTQTDGPLFSRTAPAIVALRDIVTKAVEAHVAQLPPQIDGHPVLGRPRGRIRYAGSWSVRLAGAGFHVPHVHSHGWISAALYIALPPAIGGDDHAGWLQLGAPPAELGTGLAPTRLIEPVPARLVLFPSVTWHGTLPFATGERLTVAFDAVPARG